MPSPFTLSPSNFKDKAPSLGACLVLTPCPVGRAWMHLLHMRGVVPHPMLPPGGQRLGLVPGLPRMGPRNLRGGRSGHTRAVSLESSDEVAADSAWRWGVGDLFLMG